MTIVRAGQPVLRVSSRRRRAAGRYHAPLMTKMANDERAPHMPIGALQGAAPGERRYGRGQAQTGAVYARLATGGAAQVDRRKF